MIDINIEGQLYKVSEKDNLLKICLSLGFDIPYFCWHPVLGSIGSCRQCAIKQSDDPKKKNEYIIMSCMSAPINNSHIIINDSDLINFRKKNIELLMLNHPHDCPICDEGGSCHLQDMTVMAGHNNRRYNFLKREYKNQYLGPFISHTMNRCITCYRCVRFYKDYADGQDFNVFGSKNNIYFGRYIHGRLKNIFSGNLIELCPTGVFTDKVYNINYSRKWDLQYAPSICQNCSLGCNIFIGERYGKLSSIQNRFHEKINHYFLCDKGYFGYDYTYLKNNPIKIIYYQDNKKLIFNYDKILKKIIHLILNSKNIIGIGSPRASIESNVILKKLVGKNNFYLGILKNEKKQINYIIDIIQNTDIYFPTLSEIENYDTILIIGEDLSNTNPRAALAVRQAIKKYFNIKNNNLDIPYWKADAISNMRNKKLNPLLITSNDETLLDDISLLNYYASTLDQSILIFTLADYIKNNNIIINDPIFKKKIIKIKKILLNSKKPLIISGTSSNSLSLISASYSIAKELYKKNKNVGLFYVLNEVNSMGTGLIKGKSLNSLFLKKKSITHINSNIDTIFIMENDLYIYEDKNILNNFFKNIPNIIVLDHIVTRTMKKANIILPVTNFMENSGTVINNECRAQRYFQVYNPSFYNKNNDRKSSWKWIYEIYAKLNGFNKNITLDEIIKKCEKYIPILNGINLAAPPATYKVYNRKFARSSIRYSGRTSMFSNINIHEPQQPKDKDTIFNFSMEGNYGSDINYTHIPFLWAPGWNSSQALHKFQKEIGISSKYGITGFKICKKNKCKIHIKRIYHKNNNVNHNNQLIIIAHQNLFQNNSLMQKSNLIKKYFKNYYVIFNKNDAKQLGILNNYLVKLYCLNNIFILKTHISKFLNQGLISLPLGVKNIPLSFLGKIIEKIKVLK
ncbi:NADH-quinone oxidoreductase subunit NuoG [Enterobacteriaceae endosymbiont of Donacia crassipes]|uniref:NADH-quinone oxidoreductase subunit NuoG n=1 Tax=Enterobacteriaceae endosymbiont of Donacia crassipes TaxID=2675776 RepID=UPI0014492A2F|nr:NADH-quinone oxidoreductase subunit NuoG [Enterobacteriaceae endosymbiont of Donacia crassipes]QJC34649.1 NADH-quinone oxidoreductase subunit NuoG [Enterobacteriaceae endosymbiont of Donacia crassipes]